MTRLEAATRRLPRAAVFAGLTAAWLHGLDVEPCSPIEVIIPKGTGVSARSGLVVRRAALDAGELVRRKGLPATSMSRTLLDLCRELSLTEAVVVADMALHVGAIDCATLAAAAGAYDRSAGVLKLREVSQLAEPATESPMETRLRMLLVLSGLPRPEAQVSLHDSHGRFLGRPDLYFPDQRLAIEYDGGVHRDSLAADNQRQNRLMGEGIRLLRFTATDVLNSSSSVIAQVRGMLGTKSNYPPERAPASLKSKRNPREPARAFRDVLARVWGE
jgi:hypothetical protein